MIIASILNSENTMPAIAADRRLCQNGAVHSVVPALMSCPHRVLLPASNHPEG